ncbi:MAG: hypothetical protein KAR07_11580 [Spirochaetes bacterium]|nr:hypothetical protein [Spirochaetota bacterium]
MKNKFLSFTIFIVLSFFLIKLFINCLYADENKKYNILDYYRMIPQEFLKIKKYKLKYYKDDWGNFTWGIHMAGLGHIPIIVDIKNGYINFDFSGAGARKQQVVLFKDKYGRSYIGVNFWQDDGFALRSSKLKIYRVYKRKWEDVTLRVLPRFPYYEIFMNKSTIENVKEIKRILSPYSLFLFDLPRYGLDLKMRILSGNIRILIKHKYKPLVRSKNNKLSVKDIKLLKNFLGEIEKKEIKLKWDYNKGKFYY